MKRLTILALFALSACAHPEPGIRVETVEVIKPVPVYCATREQIPAEPALVGNRLTGNAAADIGPVAESALELRKVVRTLLAIVQGCVAP